MKLIPHEKKTEQLQSRQTKSDVRRWKEFARKAKVPMAVFMRTALDTYIEENPANQPVKKR